MKHDPDEDARAEMATATRDTTQLQDWIILFGTGTYEEITTAVLGGNESSERAGEP